MNKKSLFLSLAAAVLMASCSQDELAENQYTGDGLAMATTQSFTAFDVEGETRSAIDPTVLPIAFKWAEGDQLAIYSGGKASGMTNFDLVDGIDSEVAIFKANGFSLAAGAQYFAFTPYDGNQTDKTKIAFDYNGQVQAANGTFSHLGAKDFQYSTATTASSTNANDLTKFDLMHLGGVCRFQLTVPEAGVFTEFTLSGKALSSEGTFNITDASLTCKIEEEGSISLSLVTSSSTGISVAAGGVITLYLMLPQQDLSGKDLTATLNTADKTYSAELNGKNIVGGKSYAWTADVKAPVVNPLLDGEFSVSATKKVQFTKGNLWWDGSDYHFEANQTDYPNSWNVNHVAHFYWTSSKDYLSGNASYMPYAQDYDYSSRSTSDKFFCGEDNPLTVDGTSGCYALNDAEWYYLLNNRPNAANLYKHAVTVDGMTNCLIFAPDDFSGTLKDTYTLKEINSLGLVCLPPAGNRNGSTIKTNFNEGYYWSSTNYSYNQNEGLHLEAQSVKAALNLNYRKNADCIRLVRNPSSTTTTHDYVEIGGKKWATMNLGATTVAGSYATCAGDFYAWGETTPRYTSISWSGSTASVVWKDDFENYGYGSYYLDFYTEKMLDDAHDAVASHPDWGDGWHIPTREDYMNLAAACSGEIYVQGITTLNTSNPTGGIYWLPDNQTYFNEYKGVAGVLFVDKSDTSKRVFFPAAGYMASKNHQSSSIEGLYWTSWNKTMYDPTDDRLRCRMTFSSSDVNPRSTSWPFFGQMLRPVKN